MTKLDQFTRSDVAAYVEQADMRIAEIKRRMAWLREVREAIQ